MLFLSTKLYLPFILIHIHPFLQMEKSLPIVLLKGASMKYALKTVLDWLKPGPVLERDSLDWS